LSDYCRATHGCGILSKVAGPCAMHGPVFFANLPYGHEP
jgi:hypothetical protein